MKNRDKTWRQILEECDEADPSGELSWMYVTALRGPDIMTAITGDIKRLFTCPLRGKLIGAPFATVGSYEELSLERIEDIIMGLGLFEYPESPIIKFDHYLKHIMLVWRFFHPKVEEVLWQLGTEPLVKKVAREYKQAVDEWLDKDKVVPEKIVIF